MNIFLEYCRLPQWLQSTVLLLTTVVAKYDDSDDFWLNQFAEQVIIQTPSQQSFRVSLQVTQRRQLDFRRCRSA